jgi:hypothetical protein
MRSAFRSVFTAAAALAMVGAMACGSTTSTASHTSSSTNPGNGSASTPSTSGGGQLDPKVAMPNGFPSDFPVYPGARPTAQGQISSNGKTTWEVTWQTLDGLDKVQAFYTDKLKQGDWTISFEASATGTYSAIFTRKSDDKFGGILGADSTKKTGVTEVSVVLGQS